MPVPTTDALKLQLWETWWWRVTQNAHVASEGVRVGLAYEEGEKNAGPFGVRDPAEARRPTKHQAPKTGYCNVHRLRCRAESRLGSLLSNDPDALQSSKLLFTS